MRHSGADWANQHKDKPTPFFDGSTNLFNHVIFIVLLIALFILKGHQFQSPVMSLTQEVYSMACIALQFVILCYLIKIYRAVMQLGMNHQQPFTKARNRSNSDRINDRSDIAGLHIRFATEHDERDG